MIELVYNRTQADVDNNTEKAFIDYEDLNRVGGAAHYVAAQLRRLGYNIHVTAKNDWVVSDIRTKAEMDKLKADLNALRNAVAVNSIPQVPNRLFESWKSANTTEKILHDVDEVCDAIWSTVSLLGFDLGKETIRAAKSYTIGG